jgi:hypothetical protein
MCCIFYLLRLTSPGVTVWVYGEDGLHCLNRPVWLALYRGGYEILDLLKPSGNLAHKLMMLLASPPVKIDLSLRSNNEEAKFLIAAQP